MYVLKPQINHDVITTIPMYMHTFFAKSLWSGWSQLLSQLKQILWYEYINLHINQHDISHEHVKYN